MTERLGAKPREAAKALGLGLNSTYEGIRKGEIPSVRVGTRIIVPWAWIKRVMAVDAPAKKEG